MLQLKNKQRGMMLLKVVGACGEFPVRLVREMGGYYDYLRRIVTELVREGYLKERRMKGYRRRMVRSLSLTEKGLLQIKREDPVIAKIIQDHAFSPGGGQGDWKKTLRLHRSAACYLAALRLGALWRPGREKRSATVDRLVYYSAYEFHRMYGSDRKGSRVSGVFFYGNIYFPVCWLGANNMFWNQDVEQNFREQLENSPIGKRKYYGGHILLGEEWDLAGDLVLHGINPRTRMIRFGGEISFYYTTLDRNGLALLRLILDSFALRQFQWMLDENGVCGVRPNPEYLFDLQTIADYYEPPNAKRFPIRPIEGHFFDFQMSAMERINTCGARIYPIPSQWLELRSAGPCTNAGPKGGR